MLNELLLFVIFENYYLFVCVSMHICIFRQMYFCGAQKTTLRVLSSTTLLGMVSLSLFFLSLLCTPVSIQEILLSGPPSFQCLRSKL